MKKMIDFLTSKIKFLLLIYFLIQLVLIFTINVDYQSDALYYYNLAQDCIRANEFYPAKQHLFEDYIVAPLYINTLTILLKVYDSTKIIRLFNFAVICLQIFFLYKVTIKIFSENISRLTLLLYLLYLNSLGLMVQNYTELFFLLLITTSIYFYTLNKNIFFILSGCFLSMAIAVRPIGWALLIAFISIHLYKIIKKRRLFLNYFQVYTGTLIFILLFGGFTALHFGKFEFTSTTGPVNILIGANDDATGAFDATVFEKDKEGYIEFPDSLTYIQKGNFYREKAIKWISKNLIKWILLAPVKFLNAYSWDDVSISNLLGNDNTNFLHVVRLLITEKDFDKALPDTTTPNKVLYFFILILTQLFYYSILLAIVSGIYLNLKSKSSNELVNLILLFTQFATIMIMITVGTPRYRYPMFILLLPFAAYYIDIKFRMKDRKFTNG